MSEKHEYVFNDIEEMKTFNYCFDSIPEHINMMIEGDFYKITLDDYNEILENCSRQLPEKTKLAYSNSHKTDINPPYRIYVSQIIENEN